jgi:hypothetical protein
LQGRDIFKFRHLDRGFVIKRHMRAQEVVVGDKESGKRDSAIGIVKAMRRLNVVFIGSVETFDDLFKGSELFRLLVEVLKADDLMVLDRVVGI